MNRFRFVTALTLGISALFLSACGEKPQTNAHGVRFDAPPWTGTSTGANKEPNTGTAFTAPGWQIGDQNAWRQQLKTRAQNSQNEYNRIN